jgi:hypothetical protein
MTKAAIPTVRTGKGDLDLALSSVKQNLDAITGQGRNVTRFQHLSSGATLAEVIARLNEIVDRLQ